MKNIRDFPIITHTDHGRSTPSDRITQIRGDLSDRKVEAQVLDPVDLERERGITIKAQSVTLGLGVPDGEAHQLNFIDIPGHADFSYEISRLLATCEGALLVVDTGQGVEAQTPANYYTAVEMDLEIVLVLNKIGLSAADPERVAEEIEDIAGIDAAGVAHCSARTGAGVTDVLGRLVCDIPPPEDDPEGLLQVLIIGPWFDNYLDVMSLVRIKNGIIRKGDKTKIMSTDQVYNANHLSIFMPKQVDHTELKYGEVGWLACATKDILGAPAGDILTQACNPVDKPLPGPEEAKPQVYAGLFSMSSDDYENSRGVFGKLSLSDASLSYEPENSTALDFGFRYGLLGLLHMEIIQECLECEYDLDLITTTPTVVYKAETTAKGTTYVDSPSKLPPLNNIYELRGPVAEYHMLLPQTYLGDVITLCIEKRGVRTSMVYRGNRVVLTYGIPVAGVVLDFLDRLKPTSHGYASLNHNFKCFQVFDTVRIDVLIDNERVDALVLIIHRDDFQGRGRELVGEVKDLIPRQQLDTAIQAATGTHIIVRSTVKQLCKDVLTKCYSDDISRKEKLLQKQKEGKKRTKQISNVELPWEALLAILHVGKDSR